MPGSWDDDYAQTEADVQRHTDMVNQLNQDQSDYKTVVLPQFDALLAVNPEQALLYFLYVCMASPNPQHTDNILSISEDQYGIVGSSMAVMGDITKMTDDLQNYTNGSVPASIDDVYNATAQLQSLLAKPEVQSCFDPEALSTIQQQLGLMQDNITQYFNCPANPKNNDINPQTGKNFQPSDPNYADDPKLQSIAEMQKNMGLKGDPKNATEAAQGFTDPESVMTSSSQSINAELNQEVSTDTSFEKNEQSFMSSLIKSMIDETNTAVQNQSKQ